MNLKHSGSKANVKPLTKLERKILEILGPDFTKTPYRGRTLVSPDTRNNLHA